MFVILVCSEPVAFCKDAVASPKLETLDSNEAVACPKLVTLDSNEAVACPKLVTLDSNEAVAWFREFSESNDAPPVIVIAPEILAAEAVICPFDFNIKFSLVEFI